MTISVHLVRYPQRKHVVAGTLRAHDACTHPSQDGTPGSVPPESPWKLVVDRSGRQEECSPCQQHRRTAQREPRPSRGRPNGPGSGGVDRTKKGPARLGPARHRPTRRWVSQIHANAPGRARVDNRVPLIAGTRRVDPSGNGSARPKGHGVLTMPRGCTTVLRTDGSILGLTAESCLTSRERVCVPSRPVVSVGHASRSGEHINTV